MTKQFFQGAIRRRVLLKGALGAAAVLLARGAVAAPANRLSPDDAQAQALGYVEDAATVDVAKWPRKAGPGGEAQNCFNCALYQPQQEGWGGCGIFPGKLVAGPGWCNAWVPKS